MTSKFIMSLKPVWLLGCGAGLGLALLLVIGAIVCLFPGGRRFVLGVATEIIIWPVLLMSALLALFSASAAGLDELGWRFFDQKESAWKSALRLTRDQEHEFHEEIAAGEAELIVPLEVRKGELGEFKITVTRPVVMTVNQPDAASLTSEERFYLQPGEELHWTHLPGAIGPLTGQIETVHLRVLEPGAAIQVTMTALTRPVVPEARIIPIAALGLVLYVGFFLVLEWLFPRLAAVTVATAREAMSQPLFYLLLAAGPVFLLIMLYLPFFTFGQDVRQFKDSGLTVIMVTSIFFAVWTASVSVADEIEGRTALTVLSKPIGRREFILGKYLGILAPVAVNFILVGTFFLMLTSYKVVYDARESASLDYVNWQQCYAEMAKAAPGLVLYFMEVAVLTAVSVAIATRMPLLPNLLICTSIYMIGNLLPELVKSTAGRFEIVTFTGQLFATVLPVLNHFNVYAAVASGNDIPASYLGWVALYSLNYIAIAMLLALALFEDRDLA